MFFIVVQYKYCAMPLQLQRIILLFALFIILFLGLRFLIVPESFGEYGHYRGASLEENKNRVPKYIDQEECANCHEEIAELTTYGLHDIVSCQICHGPGYLHQDTTHYVEMYEPRTREFCGICHQVLSGRPNTWVNQVSMKEHNLEENCIDCHNPHEPWLELE